MARGVSVGLREAAKDLRRASTTPEALLWRYLRNRGLGGAKFRRQHPFGAYVLDFYCSEQSLVIELDGAQHQERGAVYRDAGRTEFLEAHGLRVLRFSNAQVLEKTEAMLKAILSALRAPSP